MRRFGAYLASLAFLAACGVHYGFSQGGGVPSHIRTMAVLPFDNETASPELTKELLEQLRTELQHRLGLRDAPQERADAIVRGKIIAYDTDVPVGFSANPAQAVTARRRLQLTIDITVTDASNGKTLFEAKQKREEGEYAERAEAEGRREAIKKLVTDIIERLQSQW